MKVILLGSFALIFCSTACKPRQFNSQTASTSPLNPGTFGSAADVFKLNQGTFSGTQKSNGKDCGLIVRSAENDQFQADFSYFDRKGKKVSISFADKEFDSNAELAFIQVTKGFLFGEKTHGITWEGGLFTRFWVNSWSSEEVKCDFTKYVDLNGTVREAKIQPQ